MATETCQMVMNEEREANLQRLEHVLGSIEAQDPMLRAVVEKVREEGMKSLEDDVDGEVMPIKLDVVHEAIDRVIMAYVMELYKERKVAMAKKEAEIAEERTKLESKVLHQCVADHLCIDPEDGQWRVSPFKRCLVRTPEQQEEDDRGEVDVTVIVGAVRDFLQGYRGEKGLVELIEAGVVPQELAFIEQGEGERAFALDLIRWLETSGEPGRALALEIVDNQEQAKAVLMNQEIYGKPLVFLAMVRMKYQMQQQQERESH